MEYLGNPVLFCAMLLFAFLQLKNYRYSFFDMICSKTKVLTFLGECSYAIYITQLTFVQFYYRYGSSSTGVSDFWIKKNSWISLRQVSLSYQFSPKICQKLLLNNLSVAIVGRDLLYLYNSLPYNYNPASNNSNNTAFSGEEGFLPMVRSIAGTIRVGF